MDFGVQKVKRIMINVFGNVTMDLTIEQRLLLIELRMVKTNTLLGESISISAHECHSKEEFDKLIEEIISFAIQNEKLVLDLLGNTLLLKIKTYQDENSKN